MDSLLQLFFIGFTAAIPQLMLITDEPYPLPPTLESLTPVSYHLDWFKDESECRFTGVMVPFTRDWAVEVDNGITKAIDPPEPDKTIGHAFVLNKKICPGKEPVRIFRVDDTNWILGKAKYGSLKFAGRRPLQDVLAMREDQKPKWLPQVMARIERLSASDADARAFVEFNNTHVFQEEAKPE